MGVASYFYKSSLLQYFRHELLVVPRHTDRTVPDKYIRHKQNIITDEDYEAEYKADEWDSDDSRA